MARTPQSVTLVAGVHLAFLNGCDCPSFAEMSVVDTTGRGDVAAAVELTRSTSRRAGRRRWARQPCRTTTAT